MPTVEMGEVTAWHANETNYVSDADARWVGIGLCLSTPKGPVAIYSALTPDEARQHAAELLRIADKLDNGKGTQ